MDYDQLRPLTLLALKEARPTQIANLIYEVEKLALGKGFYSDVQEKLDPMLGAHKMPEEDREKVREIIHELVMEGILMWGLNEHNSLPPWIKITRYGEDCLKSEEILPYDPVGYLKLLCGEIPSVDETIKIYVDESLQTFLRGNMFASTVMLGGASEKAILLLIESTIKAIADRNEKGKFENEMGTFLIGRKFESFKRKLDSVKGNLPKSLTYGLDNQLAGVFEIIRTCRNEVGHPTGRKIERYEAFRNLQLFIPYCKRIYELIVYFDKNRV